MNKIIKTSIVAVVLAGWLCVNLFAQSVASLSPALNVSTNITTITQTNIVLLTNSCKISQVQVLAGAANVNLLVYDNNATNQTITNSAYSNRLEYLSNIVTIITNYAGTTNTQTNTVLFETNVLNAAATNNLTYRIFPAQASTLATYPVNMLQAKGIMIVCSTNASIVITYRIND